MKSLLLTYNIRQIFVADIFLEHFVPANYYFYHQLSGKNLGLPTRNIKIEKSEIDNLQEQIDELKEIIEYQNKEIKKLKKQVRK